ncbi:acyl-CoA dehydrogenase [Comamonas thiooxydans]|nr:acyl-CoA dehydrogenase [Comamonas thiooxydans]
MTSGPSPWDSANARDTRQRVRDFALTHIAPYVQKWEEEGTFPMELYLRAADAGILGMGFPAQYGGTGGALQEILITKEELARFGSGGVRVGLTTHTIALPPILALGCEAMKSRVIPQVLAGEKLAALAVSEPEGGSDVASLNTTAELDGDSYVVNGRKLFISTGIRGDFFTTAVRTSNAGKAGISLLLIEKGAPGFEQIALKKSGWWSSDTAELVFTNCRVPTTHLIGEESAGFKGLMSNFNQERLGNAAIVLGAAKACYDETVNWTRSRQAFGSALIDKQVVRHMIVDMATQIQAVDSLLSHLCWRYSQGGADAAQIAMLKNLATSTYEHCAATAVQLHGGHGVLRRNKVDRLFRESKILSIGGGAVEILKDLAAKQLGL